MQLPFISFPSIKTDLAMADPLSHALSSLTPNCARIRVMPKKQWPLESTGCFLKPHTYPPCRIMARGRNMEKIKKFHNRGYPREPEKVELAATVRNLKMTVAKQDDNVNKLEQNLAQKVKKIDWLEKNMNDMKSRVEKMEKKFARLSRSIRSAWSDYDSGNGGLADESPTHGDADATKQKKTEAQDIV